MVKERVGNYICGSSLGRGSYGNVYHASHIDPYSPRQVAIKLFYDTDDSDRYESTFRREVDILNQFHHQHIVQIYDYGIQKRPDGTHRPYVIMEYAAGGSLRQRLEREFVLPIETTIQIVSQIADALFYAHEQGIVHCDLKPENILFSTPERALLADFGISVVLHAQTKEKIFAGTYCYMPPEQFRHEAGRESDQYALACIAYEMLTGQKPFLGDTPEILMHQHLTKKPIPAHQLNRNLSVEVDKVLQRGLAKERHDRYPSILEFSKALEEAFTKPTHPTKEDWQFIEDEFDDLFDSPRTRLRYASRRIISKPGSTISFPLVSRIKSTNRVSWIDKPMSRAKAIENSYKSILRADNSMLINGPRLRARGYQEHKQRPSRVPRASAYRPHAPEPISLDRVKQVTRLRPSPPPAQRTIWRWLSQRADRLIWLGASIFFVTAAISSSGFFFALFTLLTLACILLLFGKNENFAFFTRRLTFWMIIRGLVLECLIVLFIAGVFFPPSPPLVIVTYIGMLVFWGYEEWKVF